MISVICISYNHAKYVRASIMSILKQKEVDFELLIVDNASTDGTQKVIQCLIEEEPRVRFFPQKKNLGNCKAFNLALSYTKGEYIVDLSADDIFYPYGLKTLWQIAKSTPANVGVIFADLDYINSHGLKMGTFYPRDANGKLIVKVEDGDIYKQVLSVPPHLSACTMMIKREVLYFTGGYDETLAYEDYDFWIRSARKFYYAFVDKKVMAKRVLRNSLGERFYHKGPNPLLVSTLKICHKAKILNQNTEEDKALATSVRYHMRLSLFTENYHLAIAYAELLHQLDKFSKLDDLILLMSHWEIPLYHLYSLRMKWKSLWK